MEQDVKVFSSEITRGLRGERNNLYELLNIEPAKPIRINEVPKTHCTFQPKSDKYYEYKKKSKLKVKSVRDIRNSFEKDISIYLPMTLEKQQNMLMKRIRDGCSTDEGTKKLATNILKSDNPISRTAWQMLTNINPEGYTHPKQYIQWNGRNIRVCGSKGGHDKYITKYEMLKGREVKHKTSTRKNIVNKKKCLLQNSLSIKIKPGPLTQKKYIDDSYQKYHVGNLELIDLPKLTLEVIPSYGSPMESTIRSFVSSLRDSDGIISQKWAEFSVSMLGTVKDEKIVQLHPNACTTFDLRYKYDQKKMLMRRDIEHVSKTSNDNQESIQQLLPKDDNIMEEVTKVMLEIIDSVEISLNQDNMYTGEEEERTIINNVCSNINSNNNCPKEKNKKKFGELDRLHVTVIRLPENTKNADSSTKMCNNSFCVYGCICESLNRAVIVKGHCGQLECMFQCKCDFSSYKEFDNYDNVCPDFMPGLLKLDKEMNLKLAKEEQKFHQTVVLSGDKSILLKPHRRSWKASTKYSDFYKTMSLKTNNTIDRDLVVVDTKIHCDNIEPWCMVHNLYKCFCKGRFVNNVGESEVKHFEVPVSTTECDKMITSESSVNSSQPHAQTRLQELIRKERYKSDKTSENTSIIIDLDDPMMSEQNRKKCARVEPYAGRKYFIEYYRHMHTKIREMEKDDVNLLKKLKNLISIEDNKKKCNSIEISSDESTSINEFYGNKKIKKRVMEKEPPVPSKKRRNIVNTQKINNNNINVSTTSKEIEPTSREETEPTSREETEPTSREETPELSADHIRENILSGGFATSGVDGSNKGKLVAWLEYSYKQYKERCELGITKLTLQAPQPKKMALLPWNFILERYKERKNLFLVSKQKPFRMVMAVNRDHPFLQDCLNIDDIRFADLYKYPITVKKLLTNASDLKNSFCILCGHAYCWELIGSVTKVNEPNNINKFDCDEFVSNDKSLEYNESSGNESEQISTEEDEETSADNELCTEANIPQSDSSKWFVMTIEKDFSEIQFFNRGFFVKYDSIIKAINIARYSHKTVRLSSQKCAENSSDSQFGIYAIPSANEDCVFIGPYECNEPLGIETVKSIAFTRQLKRTRGYWITTNKVDNIKVIESPMSFMPDKNTIPNEILSLKSNPNERKDSFSSVEHTHEETNKSRRPSSTDIAPKSINEHPVSSNSLLKLPKNVQNESNNLKENTMANVSLTNLLSKFNVSTTNNENDSILTTPKHDADSKQVDSVHMLDRKNGESKTEGSTFAILKPEEINQRIMNTKIFTNKEDLSNDSKDMEIGNTINPDSDIESDINKFISTLAVEKPLFPVEDQNQNVFVISDEEEECLNTSAETGVYDVWLECKNIENFGWIPGKQNLSNGNLSFQFPGFNYTELYSIDIALKKLTQVLSRKICIPISVKLEWQIVSNKDELKSSKQLCSDHLGSHLVLTKKGPRRKVDLLKALSSVKTYSRKPKAAETASVCEKDENDDEELK